MNPCVVVANSCGENISPESVIKSILDIGDLPEPLLVIPEVRGYCWHIDTKYYEADVLLCALDKKTIGTEQFADSVNALILPFDSHSADGLQIAEQWLSFTDELDPEVKILLCQSCGDEEEPIIGHISKLEAQSWCVKNGFELVELNPCEPEEDPDLEDDFPETTGIKRVVQALHAHIWPNLEMKGDGRRPPSMAGLQHALNGIVTRSPEGNNPEEIKDGNEGHNGDCGEGVTKRLIAQVRPTPKETASKPNNVAVVSPMVSPLLENEAIQVEDSNSSVASSSSTGATPSNPLSQPSPTRDERFDTMLHAIESMPEENFEELFQNLNEMKTKALSLSPSQRKEYAEKLTIAFWKSIGGNDSEVEGISSDDD